VDVHLTVKKQTSSCSSEEYTTTQATDKCCKMRGKLFRVYQVTAATTSWELFSFYQLYSTYATFEVTAVDYVRASGASTANLG